MLKETRESVAYPGTSYTFRPINGPKWANLSSARVPHGDALYDAFEFVCLDWKDAPLLGGEKAAEYDRTLIHQLMPSFVDEVVGASMNHWLPSEDDEKNS